jgi:hypothetical protein
MYKVVINSGSYGVGISEAGVAWLLAHGAGPEKVEADKYDDGEVRYYSNMERHDPLFVAMVEALGDAAGDERCSLRVEEIASPLYRIVDYDSYEVVETPETAKWSDARKVDA